MNQSQVNQLIGQIGHMNLLAVCGGRRMIHNGALEMAVGGGYRVLVFLSSNDTYEVRRVFVRKGEYILKGTVSDVYNDQIAEVVWQASLWRDNKNWGN